MVWKIFRFCFCIGPGASDTLGQVPNPSLVSLCLTYKESIKKFLLKKNTPATECATLVMKLVEEIVEKAIPSAGLFNDIFDGTVYEDEKLDKLVQMLDESARAEADEQKKSMKRNWIESIEGYRRRSMSAEYLRATVCTRQNATLVSAPIGLAV